MQSPRYYLRDHSFVCLAGRYYVILDLLGDKYWCVEKRLFEALAPRISLPSSRTQESRDSRYNDMISEAQGVLSELLERGLLTENSRDSNAPSVQSIVRPNETLMSETRDGSLARCTRYIPSFIASVRVAAHSLVTQSIAETVNPVADRRRQHRQHGSPFDLDRAAVLTSIFYRLRPFYNREYLCLFDSLALLEFLARYSLFPTWVFAVQSEPFMAHCWIQENRILLNDTVDRVSVYTPILAV